MPNHSTPATPPTPPVPLAALLADEDLGLRSLTEPADPADILWVHASEMADPYPYLLGGELVLTAGVQLGDPFAYVTRLVAAGAVALGFGVAPVHEAVPPDLVAACERYGLPLLEVPPRTPFTAVARAVWRLMSEARHRELRRVTRAQQALATAAARPDPVRAVLHRLAARLDGHAALYGTDGEVLRTAGPEPAPEAAAALARLARLVSSTTPRAPASAADTLGAVHLSAYALGGGSDEPALGIATPRRTPGDHTITAVATVLLSLLTAAPHRSTAGTEGRDAALVRLLLGAAPTEVAGLLAETQEWTVAHAHPTTPTATTETLTIALTTALTNASGPALLDANFDSEPVRLLLPGCPEVPRVPGWTLGISSPTPMTELRTADTQAARALAHARATRAPLVHHRPATALTDLVPPAEAAARARTLLAPLTAPLPETLRCWLSLHGNWDRTAVALGVHRNTVRQRIARCAGLLDMDLDEMDVRTELWFALRHI
ncbi:PucR family transcriptional regulator [Streptomyces sp. DT24]|uniref:PucR family transcriptional regulator n=1 Tax=Streptomyces sp. DT24 TaxID=3416520 RepID=UPI003CE8B882